MTEEKEWVSLPSELANCGCPRAASGTHRTSCIAAQEFEKNRTLEEGKRYQAVSWDYPFELTGRVSIRVSIDPIRYILANRQAYEQFHADPGEWDDWEKPVAFIFDRLEEDTNMGMGWFHGRGTAEDWSVADDFDLRPMWSREMFEAVERALGRDGGGEAAPEVDPNQGALDV